MYVLRLATEVDWDIEQECFQTFCRETAKFFSIRQHSVPNDEVCLRLLVLRCEKFLIALYDSCNI